MSRPNETPKLLKELVAKLLPENSSKEAIEGYQNYAVSILSSRIQTPNLDETTIRTNILRKIEKKDAEENVSKHRTNEKTSRVHELFQNLSKRKVLKNRFSICYLLWKISKENEKNTKTFNSVSTMDTVFSNKQGNGLRQKSAMEIENLEPSQAQRNNSLLRKTETKENILKIVHQISNKGNPAIDVSENDLLRDILFAFQGIDGNYIYFSTHEDRYAIKPTISLSEPVKKLVLGLCEIGWFYKRVSSFISEVQHDSKGLVHQSLCEAIKEELSEYYRLIAMLESLRDADDEQSRSSYLVEYKPAEKSLSLRKLKLWTSEPLERLKWMCIICDACKNLKGNVIISSIYSYSRQGSPSTQALVNRILKKVLGPFSSFLYQWVYKGELVDQNQEFFITLDPYVKDDNLWASRYHLKKEMVPGFIDLKIAEKILTTGKSVNFMKKYAGTHEWKLNVNFVDLSVTLGEATANNQAINFNEWKDWAIKTYEVTNKALLSVMFDKYKLMTHFDTIKKFLLFAQGDFIQYLMDLLINELTKPANTLYKHNLNSVLETALRASNAQYINPEILGRVDVKLLDASPGDNGWDIFSLTYNVDAPLTTVITAKTITGYLRLFNILWRIKRIENYLSAIWLQHMKQSRLIDRMPEYKKYVRKCNVMRNEMTHFIENLLNYLLIEVVQSEWEMFNEELNKAQDLDDVIKYHENFVNSMLEKALLTVKSEKIYRQMLKVFELIYRFKSTQEILMSSIQEEQFKKTSGMAIEKSFMTENTANDSSLYDIEKMKDKTLDFGMFGGGNTARNVMRKETMISLKNVWKDYKDTFVEFMDLLKDDALAGILRFLTFRLDFNEYYSSIDPNNVSIRERDIEEFRTAGQRTSFPSVLTGFETKTQPWNQNKRPVSPPKAFGNTVNDSRMIIEEQKEEKKDNYKGNVNESMNSFNISHTQDPSRSGYLRTVDLDVKPETPVPSNLSDIKSKFDYLSTLLKKTMRDGDQGSQGNVSVAKTEGESKLYLKSLNFGDEPSEKKE